MRFIGAPHATHASEPEKTVPTYTGYDVINLGLPRDRRFRLQSEPQAGDDAVEHILRAP